MVFVALQCSGVVGMFYFSSTFFIGVGLSPQAARWGSVGLMAENTLLTGLSMLLTERVGRRPLLLWSGICQSVLGLRTKDWFRNEAGLILSLVAYVTFSGLYVKGSVARWTARWR